MSTTRKWSRKRRSNPAKSDSKSNAKQPASKRRRVALDNKENVDPKHKTGRYNNEEVYDLVKCAIESGFFNNNDVRGNMDNIYNMIEIKRPKNKLVQKFSIHGPIKINLRRL